MPRPEIDLTDPAFLADPYPYYDRLRSEAPAYWLPHRHDSPVHGMWMFTRYDDVDRVLKDPTFGKDITRVHDVPPDQRDLPMMLFLDPPDHTRLRSLVGAAFTPKVVRELAPRVEEIVSELLDRAEKEGGPVDLIAALALPLPVIVIAELLGVPLEDRERFVAWSNAVFEGGDAIRSTEADRQKSTDAQKSLAAYFAELGAQRRAEPKDDLISALVQVSDGSDRLTEIELIATCVLLLIAGHETTVNLIGNGTLAFMEHRDQWERLCEEPDLAPSAVEECLRYDSPVQRATFRVALDDVEIAGAQIERGQQASAVIGAANRDPDRFADPHRFDIGREPNRHLAFGKGIHFCLGAPLARLEGQIAFRALCSRYPDLALAADGPPAWRPTTVFRGLRTLPVTLS